MMPTFRFPFIRNNYISPPSFYNPHQNYNPFSNYSYNNINSYNRKTSKQFENNINTKSKNFNTFTEKQNHSFLKNEKQTIDQNNINNNSYDDNPSNAKENKKDISSSYFFDIFGIRLYFDDILIISLIFFLYNENVHDEELFISLILLLLT